MNSQPPSDQELGGRAGIARAVVEPLDPFQLGPLQNRRVIRGSRHDRYTITVEDPVEPGDIVELPDGTQLVIMGRSGQIAGAFQLPGPGSKEGWWHQPQLAISPELRIEYEEEHGGLDD